jgi:hypothetical protein
MPPWSPEPTDTSSAAAQEYLAMLREMPRPERLRRALALTALAMDLAWAGAVRHAGHQGHAAVVRRFLRQVHGDEVARAYESSLESRTP